MACAGSKMVTVDDVGADSWLERTTLRKKFETRLLNILAIHSKIIHLMAFMLCQPTNHLASGWYPCETRKKIKGKIKY